MPRIPTDSSQFNHIGTEGDGFKKRQRFLERWRIKWARCSRTCSDILVQDCINHQAICICHVPSSCCTHKLESCFQASFDWELSHSGLLSSRRLRTGSAWCWKTQPVCKLWHLSIIESIFGAVLAKWCSSGEEIKTPRGETACPSSGHGI